MSDWQAGDLALCLEQSGYQDSETGVLTDGPKAGSINTVAEVQSIPFDGMPVIALGFKEWPRCFHHLSFRKITPGHTITGSEVDQREPWKVGV